MGSSWTVAAFYETLYQLPAPRADAQTLATALDVYATTTSLGGSAALAYGFSVTPSGLGALSVSVGADGAAEPINTARQVSCRMLSPRPL